MKKREYILDNLSWENWGIDDIKKVKSEIENILENGVKMLADTPDEELNFFNIFKIGDVDSANISNRIYPLHIFEMLHLEKGIRDLSREEVVKISEILNKYSYNETVYNKTAKYYKTNYKKEKKKLTAEEIKIVEDTMRSYKKMGMHLPKEVRDKIVNLNNKIEKLASDFSLECTKNYEQGVWFSKKDLVGVPENILASFKYDEKKQKYFVSAFLRSQYRNVQTFAQSYKTRAAITKKYEQGADKKNLKRLAEILKYRNEITKILGFKTFGDLALTEQMVKKPSEVISFLENIAKSTKGKMQKEFAEAKNILKQEKLELNTANLLFAENIAKQKNVNLDSNEMSKYFEFDATIEAMFKIWEKFFGVRAKFRKDLPIFSNAKIYDFYDVKTELPLGSAIFDMVPREGKYGHACVSSAKTRFINLEGNVETCTGALICNFIKNKEGKSLMNMETVSTLFHEGGHLLHKLLGKNNYSNSGPFNTSIDFVEIHSQFSENFATTEIAVDEVARHFETGEKMPKELKTKIKFADEYFGAFFWMRQTVQSLFDQEIHGKNILKYANNPELINKMFMNLYKKYLGIKSINKSINFASHFNHMVGGYQARYYGYSVSRAYAVECWEHFVKNGFSPSNKVLKDYKNVLEAGNTIDEAVLVKKYLGRKPSVKAFVKYLNK